MRLGLGAVRELTSMVLATIALLRNVTPAVGMIPQALDMNQATTGSRLSPSAQQLFRVNQDVDSAAHLKASQNSYGELHTKIQKSVAEGKIIHVEDGEADDLWHDFLGIQKGLTPQMVLLSGGFYKLRAQCAHDMWDYFAKISGTEKPKIMTVYASKDGSFLPFDYAEGTGLLEPARIKTLKKASLDLENMEYLDGVQQARNSLRETLRRNDFTTIALKTSPANLLDIFEEFKSKIAIIWTGPVDRLPGSSSWVIKYNYAIAPDAGDGLLDIGVPIVVVSPGVGNGRMHSIVDKKYMPQNLELLREFHAFLPTDDSFAGFNQLANIRVDQNAKFSHYIFTLADSFRDEMIAYARKTEAELDIKEQEILRQSLGEAERAEKLAEIYVKRTLLLPLGKRWEILFSRNTEINTFREFCPVDQTLQLFTDPQMEHSVKEVIEVEMKRLDRSEGQPTIDVKPKQGTNVYLITQMDTAPLERQIQSVIYWMAKGEKKNPQ